MPENSLGLNSDDRREQPKSFGAPPILTTTRSQYAIHSLWIWNRWIQLAFHFFPRSWYIPVCFFGSLYLITMPSINETQTILSTYSMANVCLWFQLLLNFGRNCPFFPQLLLGGFTGLLFQNAAIYILLSASMSNFCGEKLPVKFIKKTINFKTYYSWLLLQEQKLIWGLVNKLKAKTKKNQVKWLLAYLLQSRTKVLRKLLKTGLLANWLFV